jgi:hypothetical protein
MATVILAVGLLVVAISAGGRALAVIAVAVLAVAGWWSVRPGRR